MMLYSDPVLHKYETKKHKNVLTENVILIPYGIEIIKIQRSRLHVLQRTEASLCDYIE